MWLRLLLIAGLVVALRPGMSLAQEPTDLVNLDHLIYLTETVTIDDREMALVHIYAEFPDYTWVDAAGEGLSAVDDVARAAIVYLWQYERTGDPALLDLARVTLEFVLYMQAEDGAFYNFVYDREGTINTQGGTSYKSLGWWAMRGLWALGEGVRVFDAIDPAYADTLAAAYLKTETALAAMLGNVGATITVHGFEVPAWLPGGEADVSAIGLLGLSAYYRARPNPDTAAAMTAIADGIAALRLGDDSTYPFGMHPVRANAPGFWHDWGAHMTHALVEAGMALDRQDWIDSAAAEADSFLLRHLAFERFRNMGVVPDRMGQIAYGTNMLVQAYMALYRATGEPRYARYAGLATSWYFGNNMAGVQMADPASGRIFDGINGPVAWRVNRNSGAESTIEGLMSLIVVADEPLAAEMNYAQPAGGAPGFRILEAEDGQRVLGTPVYYTATWTGEGYVSAGRYVGLGEGQRMRLQFEIEQAGDYLLYAAHLRQAASNATFTIRSTDSPPVIDGDLSDWPEDLPILEANTPRQFLRGAGLWQGPEVDSHAVRLLWDADRLYIAATVRDPLHEQPYTLSTAWQGDTLWFYMTSSPDARSLTSKFTLAQTPDGPQVWDWIHTRFLPGAEMVFTPGDGGYLYETSIPWEALDVTAPQAGQRIGLEVGRGIGGNSFMNLTGRDPDVPANLLALVLTAPDMPADTLGAPNVVLQVRVNDGDPVLLPQTVSPDSDFFWLDLVTAEPVHLEPGTQTVRYEYAGEGGSSQNPGLAKVDAFYLQPVVAHRVFALPDGRQISLTYDTLTGEAVLTDSVP
jgi:hypothetical protein